MMNLLSADDKQRYERVIAKSSSLSHFRNFGRRHMMLRKGMAIEMAAAVAQPNAMYLADIPN